MDINAVLAKIRPGSAYFYGGSGVGDYIPSLLNWRDKGTSKPTVREMDDGWVLVQKDIATETARDALIEAAAVYTNAMDVATEIANANAATTIPALRASVTDLWKFVGELAVVTGLAPVTKKE